MALTAVTTDHVVFNTTTRGKTFFRYQFLMLGVMLITFLL